MLTPKFSTTYEAKRKRIARLPKLVKETAETLALKDALGIVIAYQEGISKNSLSLSKLHSFSVRRKKEAGYQKPRTPLYGAGDAMERTLYNALEVIKKNKRWIVRFSRKRHHASKLTLNQLHLIHENGALIQVTDKMRAFLHYIGLHLKADTKIIRIPPRPAFRKAVNKYLRKKKAQENTFQVKRAINQLINNNTDSIFKKINQFTEREKEAMGAMV